MKIEQKIMERFQQLLTYEGTIMQTRSFGGGEEKTARGAEFVGLDYTYRTPTYDKVNFELVEKWGISCLHILKNIFNEDNDHYSRFKQLSQSFNTDRNYNAVKLAFSVLKAAKDDYENDHLFSTRILIEAEVFDDFLEQAEELLKKGHYQASAVVAGCVLEDGLRKLCNKNNITFPKKPTIEPMNVELAKIGIYNQFIKDKISSIGKLRNHAAHGEWSEFTDKNVEDMIRDVRRFIEDYFN